jgi:hypothetical protein
MAVIVVWAVVDTCAAIATIPVSQQQPLGTVAFRKPTAVVPGARITCACTVLDPFDATITEVDPIPTAGVPDPWLDALGVTEGAGVRLGVCGVPARGTAVGVAAGTCDCGAVGPVPGEGVTARGVPGALGAWWPGATDAGAAGCGGSSPGAGKAPLPSGGNRVPSVPKVPNCISSADLTTAFSGWLVVRAGRAVENALALISARTWASLSCNGLRIRAGSSCKALRTPLSLAASFASLATRSRSIAGSAKSRQLIAQ